MMEDDAVMDVGKILQDARVAKNLSLDRAAQETNIRKAYLEAIEQNDFATLQGDVFVKGIMRTYGNYLGLDGAKLVEEYKADGRTIARDIHAIRIALSDLHEQDELLYDRNDKCYYLSRGGQHDFSGMDVMALLKVAITLLDLN